MNREIKFRAWDSYGKRMSEPFGLGGWADFPATDMSEGMTALVIKFPTMQFTGIKDKNGKEIYESDIVEFGYVDTDLATFRQKGEVFWNQGWMAWGLQSPMLRIPFWDKTGHAGLTDFIVVGNVYENPELLEKENIDVKEPAAA